MALSERQLRFVREYMTDYCGARAARRAGYSPRRARVTAAELLRRKDIQAEIRAVRAEAKKGCVAGEKEQLAMLSEIVRAKITDYLDDQGRPFVDLDSPNIRAIQELVVRQERSGGEDEAGEPLLADVIRIKLRDPIRAAERLAKHLGLDQPEKTTNTVRVVMVDRGGEPEDEDDE